MNAKNKKTAPKKETPKEEVKKVAPVAAETPVEVSPVVETAVKEETPIEVKEEVILQKVEENTTTQA